jgi:hypothetical protein
MKKMKKMKKIFGILAIIAVLCSCRKTRVEVVEVQSVSIKSDTLFVYKVKVLKDDSDEEYLTTIKSYHSYKKGDILKRVLGN